MAARQGGGGSNYERRFQTKRQKAILTLPSKCFHMFLEESMCPIFREKGEPFLKTQNGFQMPNPPPKYAILSFSFGQDFTSLGGI